MPLSFDFTKKASDNTAFQELVREKARKDWEESFRSLDSEAANRALADGQVLIETRDRIIEEMIELGKIATAFERVGVFIPQPSNAFDFDCLALYADGIAAAAAADPNSSQETIRDLHQKLSAARLASLTYMMSAKNQATELARVNGGFSKGMPSLDDVLLRP